MYTTWYSRGEGGMHHHQMGQLYHGAPMIKTEAGVNSDCMMAVDYAPPIKFERDALRVIKYTHRGSARTQTQRVSSLDTQTRMTLYEPLTHARSKKTFHVLLKCFSLQQPLGKSFIANTSR
ncbi:unnamed protein product [Danaus chrysippus]|uniref:(African queen) hypothetical protein n=1 Tax=Danaus chrysippus TaxID=151541 RepID=A0A8J2QXP8_9NEOP|nr:unnamed protein product [Danaus chrysippus]